ncbi:hypothetical protein RI367_002076 [Sorochytrium milnesiophthora]
MLIFIAGNPGGGKSAVARELAKRLKVRHISYESKINSILASKHDPLHAEIVQPLYLGRGIPEEVVDRLLVDELIARIKMGHNVIFECPSSSHAVLIRLIALLSSLNESHVQRQSLVVELSVDNEDLVLQRTQQWVDPVTGTLYQQDQIDFSRAKHREKKSSSTAGGDAEAADNDDEDDDGAVDGESKGKKDDDDEGSLASLDDRLSEDGEDGKEGNDGDAAANEEQEEEAAEGDEAADAEKPSKTLAVAMKVLPLTVLNRLVRRIEDAYSSVKEQLAEYQKLRTSGQLKHLMPVPHFLSVDCMQPVSDIADAIAQTLQLNCLPVGPPPPRHIGFVSHGPPDEHMKRMVDEQVHPTLPGLKISGWGKFCPVSFRETGAFVDGATEWAVSYRQYAYLLASERNRYLFEQSPELYINERPKLNKLKICVHGPPGSETTALAKHLAAQFGLAYVSLDDVLAKFNWTAPEEAIVKLIAKKLKSGKDIPPDLMVDLVKPTLLEIEQRAVGWVLDGYPRTGDQAAKFGESSLRPQHCLALKQDVDARPDERRDALSAADVFVPTFDEEYVGYKEESSEVIKNFEDSNVNVLHIQMSTNMRVTFRQVELGLDPFAAKTTAFSHNPNLPAYIDYGAAGEYCPVWLKRNRILRKGDPKFACEYKSLVYFFSSADDRAAFMLDPEYYTAITAADLPPRRFCIIGPTGGGKSLVAEKLVERGVEKVVFSERIRQIRQEQGQQWDDVDLDQPLSAEHARVFLSDLFTKEPYASRGFVLEGFPRTHQELSIMFKIGHYVDGIIGIKVEPGVILKRVLPSHLQEKYVLKDVPALLSMSENTPEEEDNPLQTLKDDIVAAAEKEIAALEDLVAAAESMPDCPLHMVENNRPFRAVWFQVEKMLERPLNQRNSLLSKVIPITRRTAKLAIEHGYKTLSSYGLHCPVACKEQGKLSHTTMGEKPVILGQHLYWMLDRPRKEKFSRASQMYLATPEPSPYVRPKVLVLGVPQAGKTLAATRLAQRAGLAYLQIESVLESVMDLSAFALCRSAKTKLRRGESLLHQEVARLMSVATKRGDALHHGWVLDGFPDDEDQAQAFEEWDVRPDVVFIVDCPMEECERRWLAKQAQTGLETAVFPTHGRLENGYKSAQGKLMSMESYYDNICGNVFRIDGTLSKWMVWASMLRKLNTVTKAMQTYYNNVMQGKPAATHRVGLLWHHIETNWSHLQRYCPVALKAGELIISSAVEFIAEYKGHYYQMSSQKNLELFLLNPHDYVSQSLPPSLPVVLSAEAIKSSFPRQIEFMGYCPVTLVQGDSDKESVVEGSTECTVEYNNKLYTFQNEERLKEFMRRPWKYAEYVPPRKLPPKAPPIPLNALPIAGYLDQTLVKILNAALASVGKARPKLPYKSAEWTALHYIGLYLKANNPRMKDYVRADYARRLAKLLDDCSVVTKLSQRMLERNGEYIAPALLGLEYASNMSRFLHFQQQHLQIMAAPSPTKQRPRPPATSNHAVKMSPKHRKLSSSATRSNHSSASNISGTPETVAVAVAATDASDEKRPGVGAL